MSTRPGRPARAAGRVRGGLTAAALTGRGFLSFVSRAQAALATKARGAHFDERNDRVPTSRLDGYHQKSRITIDVYQVSWAVTQYHEITTSTS